MKSTRTMLAVAFLIATLGLLLSCDSVTQAPAPQPKEPAEPQPAAKPNLAVAAVNVYPAQPQVGQRFTVVVYVTNNGNAVSGDYDLAMHIKDVSRGYTYPVGTFRQSALHPGEQVPWQTEDRLVNDPGGFQYWVEIVPFLFEDGNQQDNTYGWSFQVSQ